MPKESVTQARLKELLSYDLSTGLFTWMKVNSNRIKIGDIAGAGNGNGYVRIRVDGKNYYAQRLAFLYVLNVMPDEVDHINHIGDDNRWINLRSANRKANSKNLPIQSRNKSGCTGVFWDKINKKWYAKIGANSKSIFLGYFPDLSSAIIARKAANIEHGYHQNHGT